MRSLHSQDAEREASRAHDERDTRVGVSGGRASRRRRGGHAAVRLARRAGSGRALLLATTATALDLVVDVQSDLRSSDDVAEDAVDDLRLTRARLNDDRVVVGDFDRKRCGTDPNHPAVIKLKT